MTADSVTVLVASRQQTLTKTFLDRPHPDYPDRVVGYSRMKTVRRVESHECSSIKSLYKLLGFFQSWPNACVIRGELREGAEQPILRRKTHFADVPRSWVMIDIDDLLWPSITDAVTQRRNPAFAAEYARQCLPAEFKNVRCVWQASASAGWSKSKVKVHLWFRLDRPLTSKQCRTWLRGKEHVDPSVLRSVQPHYTAAPLFADHLVDPMSTHGRLGILEGPLKRVSVPLIVDEAEALEIDETLELDPRDKSVTRDLSAAEIAKARKQAQRKATALLDSCVTTPYKDAYTVGAILGRWVAFASWNDSEHGHELPESRVDAQAARWGKAFWSVPNTTHKRKIYVGQVRAGLVWGFAQGRIRLAEQQEGDKALQALRATMQPKADEARAKAVRAVKRDQSPKAAARAARDLAPFVRAGFLDAADVAEDIHVETGTATADVLEALTDTDGPSINLEEWRSGLTLKGKHGEEIAPTEHNIAEIFRSHPALAGQIKKNIRTQNFDLVGSAPWGREGSIDGVTDAGSILSWLQGIGMQYGSTKLISAGLVCNTDNFESYDPALDAIGIDMSMTRKQARRQLRELGPSKLDTWLADYLGATDDPEYLALVGAKALIAGIARIARTGPVQVDTHLVLSGAQGLGKTNVARVLGSIIGPTGYRAIRSIRQKDDLMQLQGPLVVEISEMEGLNAASRELRKDFLSTSSDNFRLPYDKVTRDFPRKCIFISTTNDLQMLHDTDNRRYWPVTCTKATDGTFTKDVALALWREAALRYLAGELWYLQGPAEQGLQQHAAALVRHEDTWQEELHGKLKNKPSVTLRDACRYVLPEGKVSRADELRVVQCLRALGRALKHTEHGNRWVLKADEPD